ncbi:MAG TPA: hypothetical protein VJ724_14935, partial [Tahibacter sp.]|nr:hypothetical protein [Tahibacter sp.]
MKKINLSKETLRELTGQETREVGGGATAGQQVCAVTANTCNVQDCVGVHTRACPQPTTSAICPTRICT